MAYSSNGIKVDPLATIQLLKWDLSMWHQYVSQGLRNEIHNHSRKDQRRYQRCYCASYSRLQRFQEAHAELLI